MSSSLRLIQSLLCVHGPLFLLIALLPLMLRAQLQVAQQVARSDHAFAVVRPMITEAALGLDPALSSVFLPAAKLSPLHVAQTSGESLSLVP